MSLNMLNVLFSQSLATPSLFQCLVQYSLAPPSLLVFLLVIFFLLGVLIVTGAHGYSTVSLWVLKI